MFFFRIVMMSLRGLQTNLMRSLLAMLGVIIGVSAVVSAMSILSGAQKEIAERFESMGADQMIIATGSGRRQARHVSFDALKPEDADALIASCPLIIAAAPEFQNIAQVKHLQKNKQTQLLATTEAYSSMNDYQPAEGRFITREDDRAERKYCVLGYEIAGDLFGNLSAVGKRVKIDGQGFTVIGVMEKKGFLGFRQVDSQVIIPLSTGLKKLFGVKFVTMITAQAKDQELLDAAILQAKRSLRAEHRIRAGTPDDFQVFTREQAKEQVADFTQIFEIVLYSIAGISLVVGAIGIMNIMLVSVTERTREIGVRIAVGARRRDILTQFLLEAMVISCIGGIVGVVVGAAFADLLEQWTRILHTFTPPSAVLLALFMAAGVGIVSGIYPAIRAYNLDPVEALRYE
ncbi:MAG: FtsX-like permease family protein [Phycisphaerales bacterium]|nr:FtsX-like permease family protein [Phycisphaerales bacterium]